MVVEKGLEGQSPPTRCLQIKYCTTNTEIQSTIQTHKYLSDALELCITLILHTSLAATSMFQKFIDVCTNFHTCSHTLVKLTLWGCIHRGRRWLCNLWGDTSYRRPCGVHVCMWRDLWLFTKKKLCKQYTHFESLYQGKDGTTTNTQGVTCNTVKLLTSQSWTEAS